MAEVVELGEAFPNPERGTLDGQHYAFPRDSPRTPATYTECFHRDIPDHKCANTGAVPVDHDMVVDMYTPCPARLVLCIFPVVIVSEGDHTGRDRLDGDIGEGSLVRLDPVWGRCGGSVL